MPFFSPIAVSLYKQYYTNSTSHMTHLNKFGWTPMVLPVKVFKKVGKSSRHKNCEKRIFKGTLKIAPEMYLKARK